MNKTAILSVYMPYGTSLAVAIDVMYRGKLLFSFTGHKADTGEMLQKAHIWAMNRGFSKTKTSYV